MYLQQRSIPESETCFFDVPTAQENISEKKDVIKEALRHTLISAYLQLRRILPMELKYM